MSLKDIGEFGFINLIHKRFPSVGKAVIRGIGDDAAVYRTDSENVILITTDLLIEEVHFLRRNISMEHLGHKALAVNLSDIAAMGGKATCAVVALAVSPDEDTDSLLMFYEGMAKLAKPHSVELVGGDTSISKYGMNIAITVLGESNPDSVIFRDGAQAGDSIFVSGYLGDSAYGLGIILKKWDTNTAHKEYFYNAHNLPKSYLAEGKFLAETGLVHAMIDVSDGLSSDLGHICTASNVGARIYEEAIPISGPLMEETKDNEPARLSCALHGGEDYCLLLTGDGGLEHRYFKEFGNPLYRVGEITAEPGIAIINREGKAASLAPEGHNHFKGA